MWTELNLLLLLRDSTLSYLDVVKLAALFTWLSVWTWLGLILLPVRVSQRWKCQGRRIPAHPPQAGREQIWGVWLHGLSRTHSLRSNPRPIFPIEIIQIIRLMALRRVGWCPEHCKGIIDAPPGLEYGIWKLKDQILVKIWFYKPEESPRELLSCWVNQNHPHPGYKRIDLQHCSAQDIQCSPTLLWDLCK